MNKIEKLEQLSVNNSMQWLFHRGTSLDNPVVLFVHGGPGSPLMWFSGAFDGKFIDDFTVVHWDQRGSGKSYCPDEPTENYNFQQFVEDGLQVAAHLKSEYRKDHIILVGHSWGSMVGAKMASTSPQLFTSYVSVGTVSNMADMGEFRHRKVLEKVEKSNNSELQDRLENLGPPPYLTFEKLRNFGDIVIETMGFETTFGKLSMGQINEAVGKSNEYSESEMIAADEGMKVVFNSLSEFLYGYDASKVVPSIDVPLFFVQGNNDFNTPSILAKNYYENVNAKAGKTWIEFEESAHFPFYENPDRFLNVLKQAATAR